MQRVFYIETGTIQNPKRKISKLDDSKRNYPTRSSERIKDKETTDRSSGTCGVLP